MHVERLYQAVVNLDLHGICMANPQGLETWGHIARPSQSTKKLLHNIKTYMHVAHGSPNLDTTLTC